MTQEQIDLGTFEGMQVLNAAVEIPNAAGGLREPMQLDPRLIHHGDEGYLILKYKARKVRFDPIKDTNALTRVTVLDVVEGMFTEEEVVAHHLAAQAERLAEAKAAQEAAEKGMEPMPFPTDEELLEAHKAGDHASGLQPGCVECDLEVATADAEASEDDGSEDDGSEDDGAEAGSQPTSLADRAAAKAAAKKTGGAKKAARPRSTS